MANKEQTKNVQCKMIEGFEDDFYKLNETAFMATNNYGDFANDTLVSSRAGCVRFGCDCGDCYDIYDPSDRSGAAWLLLANLPIDNVRTLCAQSSDGLYHITLTNGARAFFYIAKKKGEDGKITESVGFTIPNDKTNPETGERYNSFPFSTKEHDMKRMYNFTDCKKEEGSLPHAVANNLLLDLIKNEDKEKLGLPVTKTVEQQSNDPEYENYNQAGVYENIIESSGAAVEEAKRRLELAQSEHDKNVNDYQAHQAESHMTTEKYTALRAVDKEAAARKAAILEKYDRK